MPEYKEFLISNFQTAKYLEKDKWLAPDDAFPVLKDAIVDRGVLRRRRGTREYTQFGGWFEAMPGEDWSRSATLGSKPAVAVDADGSVILLAMNHRLYLSVNSGTSYSEVQPAGDVDVDWNVVATDSDGSVLGAADNEGNLYISTDSGTNWTNRQPQLDAGWNRVFWYGLAISDDGATIWAQWQYRGLTLEGTTPDHISWTGLGAGAGWSPIDLSEGLIIPLYKSTDSGVTWTEVEPLGDENVSWKYLVTDSDCSVILASGSQTLYLSTDSGSTWARVNPAGSLRSNYDAIACSSDGSILIAGQANGRLYLSDDTGDTWSEIQPNGDVDANWHKVVCSDDGSFIVVVEWDGYLYWSDDSGATWTQEYPGSTKWSSVSCDSDGSVVIATIDFSSRAFLSTDSMSTWTETRPIGYDSKYWWDCAIDSDGSHMIASVYDGRLYTSANGGLTWTERQPAGDADKYWNKVCCDADGSVMLAGEFSGRLYLSVNSGVDWAEVQPSGAADDLSWGALACDSDGSVIVAASSRAGSGNGRVYLSTNGGAAWAEVRPNGDAGWMWSDVDVSSDGSVIIICNEHTAGAPGGYVWVSTNTGSTWTEHQPGSLGNTNINWNSVSCDSDGSVLAACRWDATTVVYISTDSGSTWTAVEPGSSDLTYDKNWRAIRVSSDGSIIIVCHGQAFLSPGGRVYISTDSGVTWTRHNPVGLVDVNWNKVDVSGDGLKFIAAGEQSSFPGVLAIYEGPLPIVGFGKVTYSGYNEVLVCDTRRVYHLHEGGDYTRIGPASVFTGDEDDHFWFQEYNGSLYFVNGVDPIYKHTPNYTPPYSVPQMSTVDVTIQTALMLFQYQNRLLIVAPRIGGVWYPNYVYWTTVLGDTVSASAFAIAPQDITPISGGYIGDIPVIFCLDGSIWHIIYTQNTDTPFVWERRQRYHGGRAKMSTVEVNHKLATMGLTRMITYDGYRAEDFDQRIRGFYSTLNDQKVLWSFGHRFLDRNYAGWCYTRRGQNDHDRVLLYNIDDNNFADMTINANSLFSVKGPWLPYGTTPGNFYFPIRDQDFQEVELAGNKTGKVIQLQWGHQDEGVNIVGDIQSKEINPYQSEGLKVAVGWVKFFISAAIGEGLTLNFYKDGKNTAFRTIDIDSEGTKPNWQTVNLGGEVCETFRMQMQFKYEDTADASEDFIILGIMFGLAPADPIRNRSEYSAT